jgi:anti-anti-sigma regulatory factor
MALSNRERRGVTFMMHLLIRSSTRSLAFAFIAFGLLVIVLDADAQGIDATRLKTLTAEQATDLVKQSKPLRLAVTELSPEVATVLASSKADLYFDALTTLTPESAAALAKCEGHLGLPKLAELSPAAAKALAPRTGVLMMGLKELSDETAAALAKRAGDTRLDSLTSLTSLVLAERLGRQTVVGLGSVRRITPEIARALCPPAYLEGGKGFPRWIDIGLTELSPEAGAAIVASRHGFGMHSLESISPEAAAAMSGPATNMRIWGLKTLSPATAAALAKGGGILDIRSFGPELTDETAEAIAKQMASGPHRMIDFNGLKKLTSPAFAVAVVSRYGGGPHSTLHGVAEITDDVAKALAEYKGKLNGLPSLTSLASAPLAAKYAAQPGDLKFAKLTTIADDIAKALATHKGKLDLSNVQSLSADAAKALASHEGELKLDGVKEISDEAAKALALAVGAVSLGSLEKASPSAAAALKTNTKILLPAKLK